MAVQGSQVELLWGMFCDHFLIDGNGKYSFVGVFERVGALTFPALHKILFVVCSLRGQPNTEGRAIVSIWTPDTTLMLSTQESPVRFGPDGRTLLVNLLYDLTFPTAGAYTFAIEIDRRPAGEIKLDVYTATPPTA
jgi:hypothetical protein